MSESDKPVKKISDVIIELDVKVNTLIRLVSNLNTNMTIVLGRLNEAAKQQVISPELVDDIKEEFMPIAVSDKPVQMRRSPVSNSQTVLSDKKIPVFQQVTDANDKIIFMADVEVVTEDKNLVVKTKTTAAGKWQAALRPGKYIVNILKKENASRKRMEYRKEFLVTDSNEPIELAKAIIREII